MVLADMLTITGSYLFGVHARILPGVSFESLVDPFVQVDFCAGVYVKDTGREFRFLDGSNGAEGRIVYNEKKLLRDGYFPLWASMLVDHEKNERFVGRIRQGMDHAGVSLLPFEASPVLLLGKLVHEQMLVETFAKQMHLPFEKAFPTLTYATYLRDVNGVSSLDAFNIATSFFP
ncbi:MAG: hypothetical protein Q7R56_00565 [Nanoarchaeota archaeon]|nr:hypothetical protein [Nanoarchaeota archaeon]